MRILMVSMAALAAMGGAVVATALAGGEAGDGRTTFACSVTLTLAAGSAGASATFDNAITCDPPQPKCLKRKLVLRARVQGQGTNPVALGSSDKSGNSSITIANAQAGTYFEDMRIKRFGKKPGGGKKHSCLGGTSNQIELAAP